MSIKFSTLSSFFLSFSLTHLLQKLLPVASVLCQSLRLHPRHLIISSMNNKGLKLPLCFIPFLVWNSSDLKLLLITQFLVILYMHLMTLISLTSTFLAAVLPISSLFALCRTLSPYLKIIYIFYWIFPLLY